MLGRLVDKTIQFAVDIGARPLKGIRFIPVLHVERLDKEYAFRGILDFVRSYANTTSSRALLTVITPECPMLGESLRFSGWSQDAYAARIRELAIYADIGLHGHYLRSGSGLNPVHAYWNETSVVHNQLMIETEWLESHRLMHYRVYSAGWWYMDSMVVRALQSNRFLFDFSFSEVLFGLSPMAHKLVNRLQDHAIGFYPGKGGLAFIPAVSGLCADTSPFVVPRRALFAIPCAAKRANEYVVSLYNHDWDMNAVLALRTVSNLLRCGATCVSLEDLLIEREEIIKLKMGSVDCL